MATEEIWILIPKAGQHAVQEVIAFSREEGARGWYRDHGSGYHSAERALLNRPDLRPIYGGPTLMEALWSEMDRLMEGLMTGTDAEDGGDKFRAQGIAYVLAITSNPYNPSVDSIRAEAMRRWQEREDQEDMNTRPEGADQ